MITLQISFTNIALGALTISLAVLILIIAYRKFIGYLGKGEVSQEEYAILYSIEIQPSKGVIDFYYELEVPKEVSLFLLDSNMLDFKLIDHRLGHIGGNKISFDTVEISNGDYFFELRTDIQKTAKKIRIENP